jgi:nucleoside-diphosphate-sugar epimerase
MPPLAVVSGASGFIGRHLVAYLAGSGWRVRLLSRAHAPPPALPGVETRAVDYSRGVVDAAVLDGAEVIFHLAGVTRGLSAGDFLKGNVEPTRLLLRAAAEAEATPRFIFMSSQAAAGPASSGHEPVTEATEPRPVEDYGRSKLAAEELVSRGRVPFAILRPSSVFGAGDRDFSALFRQIRYGLALYATDPEGLVSVVHVSDVVRGAAIAARDARAVSGTFFLTGEPPRRWREVYEAAAAVAGRRPVAFRVPRILLSGAARLGDLAGSLSGRPPLVNSRKMELAREKFWICSGARAAERLDFRPVVGLEEGFRDYLDRPRRQLRNSAAIADS